MSEPEEHTTLPPQVLSKELLAQCMSDPQKTLDGSGVAFTKLDLRNRNLSGFGRAALSQARFIRNIDACNNGPISKIHAEEILSCQDLVTLSVAGCSVTKLDDLSGNKLLQHVDVSANCLVSLKSSRRAVGKNDLIVDESAEGEEKAPEINYVGDTSDPEPDFVFAAPSLLVLLLNRNKLVSFDGLSSAAFRNLIRIEAASNEISTFAFPAEGLPALQELVLPRNKLTSLEGLAGAPRLKVLNVDFNEISSLAGLTDVVKAWGEEGRDAARHVELPLGNLAIISARNNLLAEDAWHNIDGLAAISTLRVSIPSLVLLMLSLSIVRSPQELRIAGNGLANSAYKPRQLELKLNLKAVTEQGDEEEEEMDIFAKLHIPHVGPLDIKLELVVRLPQLSRVDDELITAGERRSATEEREKRVIVETALDKASAAAAEAAARRAEEEGAAATEEVSDDDLE